MSPSLSSPGSAGAVGGIDLLPPISVPQRRPPPFPWGSILKPFSSPDDKNYEVEDFIEQVVIVFHQWMERC